MANTTVAVVFYQEVIDAIAQNPPHVGDLIVLRDLCSAVDTGDKVAVSRLTQELSRLSGVEDPLHSISYELFHALMARLLLRGWFDEFDLLMDWDQTRFKTKDERVADNWEGILKIVKAEPESIGLSSISDPRKLTLANSEEEWKRALNGLQGAFRHLAKVRLPPPPMMGAPPVGPAYHERVLPEQLGEAIEHFFRLLQILFQQILETSLKRLERDVNDVQGLWKLKALQGKLFDLLKAYSELPPERLNRGPLRKIRVAEVRYGRGPAKLHRFLDAFPPNDARSVIFNSLDREDKDEPQVRGEKLVSIHIGRDLQLAFYFNAYGHPSDPKQAASAWHIRRRAVIKNKHGGRLKLTDHDDFVDFLSNFFDDGLDEITRRASSLSKIEATVLAWRTTVNLWSLYLGQLTAHSRLNLTEGPPNYLTHAFPRNIAGRLFHDCGVYAVRTAYTLLSVLDRINRSHSDIAGTVRARWVRLPLHVGVLIESDLGLVVQHNDHLFDIDNDNVEEVRADWLDKRPADDLDPSDSDAVTLKFHEDLSASAFSSDLDMPVSSTPLLEAREPVTTKTIWNSYQKKVVPSQLFTRVVGASNAPQYQFDIRYLKLSELEREWYNKYILRFWNKDCVEAWESRKKILTDPAINQKPEELKKHKQAYTDALQTAMVKVLESYDKEIRPEKRTLSRDLRADNKLLLPGVRIVASIRIGTVLPVVRKVKDHIEDVSKPEFTFPPDYVPPFAKLEELLLEVP